MVRHPVQTVGDIQEAVTTLANLKQEDLLKIYDALKAEGKAFIFEKDISEVSREMGKAVGAALVEFALGKGHRSGTQSVARTTGGDGVSENSQRTQTNHRQTARANCRDESRGFRQRFEIADAERGTHKTRRYYQAA
jgi:uncharacterized membrane protein